jgi:hypothetical protein
MPILRFHETKRGISVHVLRKALVMWINIFCDGHGTKGYRAFSRARSRDLGHVDFLMSAKTRVDP